MFKIITDYSWERGSWEGSSSEYECKEICSQKGDPGRGSCTCLAVSMNVRKSVVRKMKGRAVQGL